MVDLVGNIVHEFHGAQTRLARLQFRLPVPASVSLSGPSLAPVLLGAGFFSPDICLQRGCSHVELGTPWDT